MKNEHILLISISSDDPMWDEAFHAAAFSAFVTVAIEQQGWPDSEKTKQRAYRLYEDAKKVDSLEKPR